MRPLNPSEWRSGAHESITPAAAAAAAAAAAGGAAAAAARLAAELGRGKAAGEDGEGGEGGEGGAPVWDPRDGIEPSKESFEEEVDPRAAETSVPIDEHPFLAALKEGPKVGVDP